MLFFRTKHETLFAYILNIGVLLACSQKPELQTLSKGKTEAFPPSSISSDAEENAPTEYPILAALPEQICSDITYRDADGVLKIGRRACSGASPCTLNGEKNCIASEAFPAVDLTGALIPALTKIHHNLTIFEHAGAMPDCSAMGEQGCYTAPGTAAVNPATIDATKILSGYALLGITGTLPTCSVSVKQDCLVSVPRKAAEKCTDGDANCYLPPYSLGIEPHKAFDVTTLDSTNIKAGVTIGGVLGEYPSASAPLDGSTDGNADLLASTFSAQLASASNFAWFDRNGVRHVHAGDADFTATNILDGVDIFGVAGSVVLPDPWDVRAGKDVGLATGKLKMNCRNGYDSNTFDMGLPKRVTAIDLPGNILTAVGHGFADDDQVKVFYATTPTGLSMSPIFYIVKLDNDTFKLSTSAGGGAVVDITTAGTGLMVYRWQDGSHQSFDTIDYHNNSGPRVTSASGGEEAEFCGDVYPTNADGLWEDVTIGTCASLADECVYRDRVTKLEWAESMDKSHYSYAYSRCDQLNFNGQSDWRLPTQKELLTASAHNLRSVNKAVWIDDASLVDFYWSSTALDGTHNFAVLSIGPAAVLQERSDLNRLLCVRGGL